MVKVDSIDSATGKANVTITAIHELMPTAPVSNLTTGTTASNATDSDADAESGDVKSKMWIWWIVIVIVIIAVVAIIIKKKR